jgi:hypothetical protein
MAPNIKTTEVYAQVMRSMIADIEQFCVKNNIDHRFVGGVSYGGLLNKTTTYDIDIVNRTVHLKNHNTLALLREDGTVKDIDFIFLTTSSSDILKLKKFTNRLKWNTRLKISFTPSISFEGPLPFIGSTIPGQFFQYVTEIGVKNGQYYLVFENIVQAISHASLEPWTLILEEGMSYTTRNPIADYYAYQFRSPSGVKPKDIEKLIHLKKLVRAVEKAGRAVHVNYRSADYFKPWQKYIETLTESTFPSVQSKRAITSWYWSTWGTNFAHGKGITGKILLGLYNLVSRLKH